MLRMCTAGLRAHLRYRRATDAELAILHKEISDYLHETLPRGKGGRIVAIEEAPATEGAGAGGDDALESEELTTEETERYLGLDLSDAVFSFHAMVKRMSMKNKTCGKAKSKGGKGWPRTCLECRAEDHIAAPCPFRTQRVAAGGLERQGKQDDPMKGGKW